MESRYVYHTMNTKRSSFLKLIHLVCVVVSGGGMAATALLVGSGSSDKALFLVFTWLVKYPFLALVLSSVLLSTVGGRGFIRQRWIAAKWVISLALLGIVMAGGGAAIEGLAALRDGLQENTELYRTLSARAPVFVGAMCALFFLAIVLSVFKPALGKRADTQAPANGDECVHAADRHPASTRSRKVAGILAALVSIVPVAFIVIGEVSLIPARRMPIERVDISTLADGTYRGSATVGSYEYSVEARVSCGRLASAVPVGLRVSPYATFAAGVLNKAVRDNRNDVDAISGATTTSKALLKALENALKGEPK